MFLNFLGNIFASWEATVFLEVAKQANIDRKHNDSSLFSGLLPYTDGRNYLRTLYLDPLFVFSCSLSKVFFLCTIEYNFLLSSNCFWRSLCSRSATARLSCDLDSFSSRVRNCCFKPAVLFSSEESSAVTFAKRNKWNPLTFERRSPGILSFARAEAKIRKGPYLFAANFFASQL